MSSPTKTTRLGTAQPTCCSLCASAPLRELFAALLLACCSAAAPAQEDVAETKSNIQIDNTPITEPAITDGERSHWSFTPIQRHPLPSTKRSNWLRTSIDSFILAKLESKDLSLSPEANRPTLLRRLTFDLIGLPPTPAELAAFEQEKSPDAFERQVDRLLASPAFGERYGQYWLDLARFAESDGYEHDYVRPHAWRYRDWVIAALNADLPYDQFIRLQLAGDELPSELHSALRTPQSALDENPKSPIPNPKSAKPQARPPTLAQIPTTFCLAGPDMPDVNDQVERRHAVLNDLTATVGAALLGLQLGCAQCHNHKYDPISQADFFRLRAVFEPAVPAYKRDTPNNVLVNQTSPLPARFYIRGDHKRPGVEVPAAFPRIASLAMPELGTRSAERGTSGSEPSSALRAPRSALDSPRSALADWLMRPDNPLPARVIANRLWQYHFGRGLSATPSDFGVMGGAVTHPELLDHLAVELRDHGWSLKHLHRTILTSATYRQASNADSGLRNADSGQDSAASTPHSAIRNPHSASPDSDNTLYSHFPRQRLTGEAIRDALLASAGLLTSERGGKGVMPPLPPELLSTLLKNQWSASQREADHYKRSIYVFARRNLRLPLFEAFDRPDGNATCPERTHSTTAPQSLLLLNSELSLLAAQHLAGRILNSLNPEPQATALSHQINQLYLLTLSRRPTPQETSTLEKFLTRQSQRLSAESRPRADLALPIPYPDSADPHSAAALVDACLAILNSNEFIYID